MQLKTIFSHITKSNHSIDVVKSALQKYARRGNAEKMFGAASEMDAFKVFGQDLPKVKAVETNMINRLKTILFEDVSFSQLYTFVDVTRMIKEFRKDPSNVELLAKICCELANAKKLRLPSHLRCAYQRPSSATKDGFLDLLDGGGGEYTDALCWLYNNEAEAVDLLSAWDFMFDETREVVEFAIREWKRTRKSKKSSERLAFLIVPFLWIIHDIENNPTDYVQPKFLENYLEIYESEDIEFDEFVYDMHTSKGNKDRQFFVKEGAFVENEDTLYLVEELKSKYEASVEAPVKRKKKVMEIPDLPEARLGDVELITEGVCGNKLPCGVATIDGARVIVKPMPPSTNFGADYEYVDRQKTKVGLNSLGIRRVKSDKALQKVEGEFSWEEGSPQIFAVMEPIEDARILGQNKELLEDHAIFKEALKIRLFNGVFRTSDNIIRNILVDKEDNLYAIDENDVLGKRVNVFNKSEPMTKHEFFTKDLVMEVLGELNLQDHKQTMIDELKSFGLERKARELSERIDYYEKILLKELKF
jgi:hypothetical protein